MVDIPNHSVDFLANIPKYDTEYDHNTKTQSYSKSYLVFFDKTAKFWSV